ncbi:hypothetical protein Droror1_Dr00008384 [Drosera rotundifolia]
MVSPNRLVAARALPFVVKNQVDMNAEGKGSLEWDLNDWKWDGEDGQKRMVTGSWPVLDTQGGTGRLLESIVPRELSWRVGDSQPEHDGSSSVMS